MRRGEGNGNGVLSGCLGKDEGSGRGEGDARKWFFSRVLVFAGFCISAKTKAWLSQNQGLFTSKKNIFRPSTVFHCHKEGLYPKKHKKSIFSTNENIHKDHLEDVKVVVHPAYIQINGTRTELRI